jgi:hypothetical protein
VFKAMVLVLWLFTPDPFTVWRAWRKRVFYRLKAKQMARIAATSHMATVARAVWSGSTEAYTLIEDLPRHDDSTHVKW